jgi:hypothetical protein
VVWTASPEAISHARLFVRVVFNMSVVAIEFPPEHQRAGFTGSGVLRPTASRANR